MGKGVNFYLPTRHWKSEVTSNRQTDRQAWLAGPQGWLAGPQAWLAGPQAWLDGPEGGDEWTDGQKISLFYSTWSSIGAAAQLPSKNTRKELIANIS